MHVRIVDILYHSSLLVCGYACVRTFLYACVIV